MSYDELRAALSAYMHRTDAETINNEPTALELARAKLNRWFFPEPSSTLMVSIPLVGGEAPLPVDYGQVDTVSTSYGDLFYVTPREFARLTARGDTGGNFTVTGLQLLVDKAVGSVSLLYYRAAEATTTSNWLSEAFPDVWLWQGIAEQHRFVQDLESAMAAEQYARALGDGALIDTRANRGGGSLKMMTRR
jgi:hypothetical protein